MIFLYQSQYCSVIVHPAFKMALFDCFLLCWLFSMCLTSLHINKFICCNSSLPPKLGVFVCRAMERMLNIKNTVLQLTCVYRFDMCACRFSLSTENGMEKRWMPTTALYKSHLYGVYLLYQHHFLCIQTIIYTSYYLYIH